MENGKLFGFLNIYKPVGMTSHDVVGYLRRVTKIRQIGHTGTLDPFAEGVLPVAIGKATRLIEYLNDDKAYIGRFCFGKSTDTYDIEGKGVNLFSTKISKQDIIDLPLPFGEIEQYPPIYSAKKINGKKAYELARSGKDLNDIELKPCKVKIYKSELLEFNYDEQCADIYIECSKGTYIRSIANDLGKDLNNGCYLSKLKRVKAGQFGINEAVNLDDLKTVEDVNKKLLNPINYLPLETLEINDTEYKKTINGMAIDNKTGIIGTVLLTYKNRLISVSDAQKGTIKVKKVFLE